MHMPRKPGTPRTVTGRIVAVLDAFAAEPSDGLTLVAISQRAALPLSTTFRLVNDLLDGQILRRDEDRRYRIGPLIFGLAGPNRDMSEPVIDNSCSSVRTRPPADGGIQLRAALPAGRSCCPSSRRGAVWMISPPAEDAL